ncbi:alpha/beta hydrolase [Planctomycetales bacterium]|nr:alpha/beta hydrolase [Planctomycetales bacterium]
MLGAEPSTLTVFRNIPYITGGSDRQKLDLYLPQDYETRKEPLPLAILIHGGGFVAGNKEATSYWTDFFANNGYATATINYRLAPEAPMLVQITDCKSAVRFLRANAKKYNLDTKRFIAAGWSAGGTHAAFLGVNGDTKAFDTGEYLEQSSDVQAVVLYWTPTNFLLHRPEKHRKPKVFAEQFDDDEYRKKVSPLFYASDKTVPTFIVHAVDDKTVPVEQGRIFYDALKEAGVKTEFIELKSGGHASKEIRRPEDLKRILDFLTDTLSTID